MVVAIAVLAIVVVPVCGGMILSARMNAKAEATLQARIAVSSAVETLMAEGITQAHKNYHQLMGDSFPKDVIVTTANPDATDTEETEEYAEEEPVFYYVVTVSDKNGLVSVTTKIRAKGGTP